MANCEYCTSCFFLNNMVVDMPHTTDFIMDKYCNGDFDKCARFRLSRSKGMKNVPTFIYPNDLNEPFDYC